MLVGGYSGLVKTMTVIRSGCEEGVRFLFLICSFPVVFQLDQFPGLAHNAASWAGTWQDGFPGAVEGPGGERCRGALE